MPILSPPEFWSRAGWMPSLLAPAAQAYAALGVARRAFAAPYRAPVPVICVGNLVVGGAGKTPVVDALARLLETRGQRPHILSRGYGGNAVGPLRVEPSRHDWRETGDEPLLLARTAPVWVGRDRAAGARAASKAGASCLILDDGFQNPSLEKDLSLVVIDGQYGLGNGRVMPAGPLREPAPAGLARADAVVLMGADQAGIARQVARPILAADLVPTNAGEFAGQAVVAFAGIGRPAKFFATLEAAGARLAARHAFPDHHPYRDTELRQLATEAETRGARLVTTEKDRVRLPAAWQTRVTTLAVTVRWRDEAAVTKLVATLFRDG